jgi:4-aminobutyrate aminotransferase/(S)-3-amino-2-methylpropionate transaminase
VNTTEKAQELQALRDRYVPKGHPNATPFFVESAKGALLRDVTGREFIDFVGGIGVLNVGHCNPKVVAAVKDQAGRYLHTCSMVTMYEPYLQLAKRVSEAAPGDFEKKAIFVNSGSEAVENAVKIARCHTGRAGVVAMKNAFHGRTLLTMSMTSKVKPYKFGFGPMASEVYQFPYYPYCYRCPLGLTYPKCGAACADKLREFFIGTAAAEQIACIVAEPVQGEGGFVVPPVEFFTKLRAICDEFGIVFVADEIQSGFGRTAKMFAMEHYGVAADLMTVAKSMGGGLPLAGVVGKAAIMDSVSPGGIGGTYGGNPLACRAGLAVFDAFDQDNLLTKAERLGNAVKRRFASFKKTYELVGDERGLGAMRAIEFVSDRAEKTPCPEAAKGVAKYCQDNGLLVLSCGNFGNCIRVLMPLVITADQLKRGLDIMEDGIREVTKNLGK